MKTLQSTAIAFLFAALSTGAAQANCVPKMPHGQAAHRTPNPLAAMMLKQQPAPLKTEDISFPEPEASIAGYWYVQFRQDGQLFDDGFDIWHNDGMEVLNDTTPPVAGAICVGIYTRTAPLTYTLKHPTWIFDDSGVNLMGIGVIRETIKLDPSGNSFTGTSTFDLYDMSGNLIDEEVSDVTGTRINALDDPKAPPTPIPGLPSAILKR